MIKGRKLKSKKVREHEGKLRMTTYKIGLKNKTGQS